MKLRYRYRIYPTKQQEQQMISVAGATRFVFNHWLKRNIDKYQLDKTFIWHFGMNKELTKLKSLSGYSWLYETANQVLQQSLKQLDQSLKNIKYNKGFPRFKSKYNTPLAFTYNQFVKIIDSKYVRLPKLGDIKIIIDRELPEYTGCTITKTARGWYISFITEINEPKLVTNINNSIGIDVNSKYVALSTSELIANPKPLSKHQKQIKLLQYRLARKQKNSKNRAKAKNKLAKLHDKITCIRKDYLHKMSSQIAKENDLVIIETLKIDEMKRKNHYTAKAIADSSWGVFFELLSYKCKLNGHHLVKINQWLPSSKTCSSCGHKCKNMSLDQRVFTCNSCNNTIHRDINAAINIHNWGKQQYNLESGQLLPVGPVDVVSDILSNYNNISQTQLKQEDFE